MEIVRSKTDNKASFAGEFFRFNDAEKMVEFAKKLGYNASITDTEERFANSLSPYRKKQTRDIDWSDWRVYVKVITMMRLDKTYDQIVLELGSESTGFAIQARCGEIYRVWDKFRDKIQGEPTDKDLEKWAKMLASEQKLSNTSIVKRIDRLEDQGCDAGEGKIYPECRAGFHNGCFSCPHNKGLIKDSIDLERYNRVLHEEYELKVVKNEIEV